MYICANCKVEMQCEKTGVSARWNITHTYPGDLFRCPSCGHEMLACTTGNCHDEHIQKYDLFMDETTYTQANATLKYVYHKQKT